jgi:Domain of unknown function (DUF4112)
LSPHLTRYRALAQALDARFRLPGTPFRFGWDAIIGLVPGAGDTLGALAGSYGLYVAARLGAPAVILARMLLNLAIDLTIGAVPVAGDLFDFAWRSNLRNVALLERWLERPHQTRRRSTLLLLSLIAILLVLSVASTWFTFWLLRRLLLPGG